MNKFYFIFLAIFIFSCSDESGGKKNVPGKRNIGVQISNHMVGGSTYFDSTKKAYAFRSIEGVVKNDTVVPIKIQIDIPETWTDFEPKQGQKYISFLLPDSMTPDKQFALVSGSPRLNMLINTKLNLLTNRTLTIQPHEAFSFKLGFLIIPPDGRFNANLFSQEKFLQQTNDGIKKTSNHDLRLYVTTTPLSSVISIGSLTFLDE